MEIDPTANLAIQRDVATAILATFATLTEPDSMARGAALLAEHVLSLDAWISRGRALPGPWQRAQGMVSTLFAGWL